MGIGRPQTLPGTLKQLIQQNVGIEDIVPAMTSNVAELLKLRSKGWLRRGNDADLVVLDSQFDVQHVMARGRWHVRNQRAVISGTYESA